MAINKNYKFDQKKIENILKTEYQFINNLFSVLALPKHNVQTYDEIEEETYSSNKSSFLKNKTSRATSVADLQSRIEKLKNKKASYKNKVQKKNLQNRFKKKLKREKRNAIQKQIRAEKIDMKLINPENNTETHEKKTEPVFNKDDKIVFSKIGFTGLGKEKLKKTSSNPKKMLEKVQQVEEKVQKLKEAGDTEKAIKIKEKAAWKNALAKAQGIKVKDDPVLLKKSIEKLEQKKRSSKKKWDKRIEGVKIAKEEKQKKRMENISKRKKDKKLNKLKKAAKKGKIIPGF